MSHAATHWAFTLRGLSSGEFRVLMVLADCHNPAKGCFPSQSFLRENCEMSNGALNSNLTKLEEKGCIKRQKTGNRASGGRAPTRYILGFEQGLTPETVDKVNSEEPEITGGLTPENDGVNSGQPETEQVRTGKKKEPVKSAREILCGFLREDTADDFIAHRKKMKAPMTVEAARRFAKSFADHPDPDAAFDESIKQGWRGAFPERGRNNHKSKGGAQNGSAADFASRAGERAAARVMDRWADQNPSQPLLPAGYPDRGRGGGDG